MSVQPLFSISISLRWRCEKVFHLRVLRFIFRLAGLSLDRVMMSVAEMKTKKEKHDYFSAVA